MNKGIRWALVTFMTSICCAAVAVHGREMYVFVAFIAFFGSAFGAIAISGEQS